MLTTSDRAYNFYALILVFYLSYVGFCYLSCVVELHLITSSKSSSFSISFSVFLSHPLSIGSFSIFSIILFILLSALALLSSISIAVFMVRGILHLPQNLKADGLVVLHLEQVKGFSSSLSVLFSTGRIPFFSNILFSISLPLRCM